MIYFLSYSPQRCARWLCDSHIKDVWSLQLNGKWDTWFLESRVNFDWTVDYIEAVLEEHLYRFRTPHAFEYLRGTLDSYQPKIAELNYMTPINCDIIPESCVSIDPTISYRNWYSKSVGSSHKWTKREAPIWIKEAARIAA